ncbi:hypothetical protein ELR57_03025 [Cohnella sp. AR92]|nr:hypothetical protein ELR57_03025 [Cohnella sp. AR92]
MASLARLSPSLRSGIGSGTFPAPLLPVLLFFCSSVLLFFCSSVLLFFCSSVLLFFCSNPMRFPTFLLDRLLSEWERRPKPTKRQKPLSRKRTASLSENRLNAERGRILAPRLKQGYVLFADRA